MTKEKLYAFIDETGCRGNKDTSSKIFGMAAVLVLESDRKSVQDTIFTLKNKWAIPTNKVMSTKDHLKKMARRWKEAAEQLSALNITVIYVFAIKDQLNAGTYVDDTTRFYNYLAKLMYERVLGATEHQYGSKVEIYFGKVKYFSDATYPRQYIIDNALSDHSWLEKLEWIESDKEIESQAADFYAGFLRKAYEPDRGEVYPDYLLRIWHQIYKDIQGCAIPFGVCAEPNPGEIKKAVWFPCGNCPYQGK